MGARLPKEAMVFSATALPVLLLDAPATVPSPGDQIMHQIPFFIFFGVIFYFLLIRPQQKQRREQQKLIDSLRTGDKVVTSGGIHGLITNVKDRTVLLKVADNVKIEIDRASVATVVERGSEAAAESQAS